MSKFSLTGWKSLSILPGLLVGMLTGLLLLAPHNRPAVAPASSAPALKLSDVEQLSLAELETLTLKALSILRKRSGSIYSHGLDAGKDDTEQNADKLLDAQLGMKNIRRLLPLAKRLTLEALSEAQAGKPELKRSGLLREKRLIDAVRRVVLDERLTDMAEVREDRLSEIRIGADYALHLISDDEAIFLLGHELTHVAARSGRLRQFIEQVAETARLKANVELTEEQKEDLACDFIGAEVLKRFSALHPTEEQVAVRFSRAVGYGTPPERLSLALDDFCASYNRDMGDEEHLSPLQTIRALSALDPELKALLPDDSFSSSLCR